MGKKLITVEKPSVARDFATALGAKMVKEGAATYYESDQYIIVNCYGHMLESLSPEEYNEEWKEWSIGVLSPSVFKKKIPVDKKAQTGMIIKLIKDSRVDGIINAGDAGREGEIIQRELYEYAGTTKPIYRFWTSDELTSTVIKATLNKLLPSKEFDGLGYAGDARERSDWIIGLSGTRSMTKAFGASKEVLSVGRVQTAILGLIVRRELAIKNFKPRNFWNVIASAKDGSVSAKAVAPESADGDRFAFWKEDDAKKVISDVKGKPYTVESFENKEVKENAPRPFSMPTLQQECSKLFGFSAEKTVEVAQSLYEKKFTTYPRTDSDYLGDEQKNSINGRVKAITSKSLIDNKKIHLMASKMQDPSLTGSRIFNQKKLTDHHAIIPTDLAESRGTFTSLSEDEKQVYTLICERFIQAFLPPAIANESEAVLTNSGHTFIARAKIYKSLGWLEFTDKGKDGKSLDLKIGVKLELDEKLDSKVTTPPERFDEAEIIKATMNAHLYVEENTPKDVVEALKKAKGIGTSATRQIYIPLLTKRGYIVTVKKKIMPMQKGINTIALLDGQAIASFSMTAIWENRLAELEESGSKSAFERFMADSVVYAQELIDFITSKKGGGVSIATSESDVTPIGQCPSCGKDVRESRIGYSCTGYKDGCKVTIVFDALKNLGHPKISKTEAKSLLKDRKVNVKLKSKTGNDYTKDVTFVEENSRWSIKVDFSEQTTTPTNPNQLVESPKAFSKDGKTIWKSYMGAVITKAQAEKLFSNKQVKMTFQKKEGGGSYEMLVSLDSDGKLQREFEPKK